MIHLKKSNKSFSLVDEIKLEFGFAWRDPVKISAVQKWKALQLLEAVAGVLPAGTQKEFLANGLRKLDQEIETRFRTKSYDFYEIVVDTICEHAQACQSTKPGGI